MPPNDFTLSGFTREQKIGFIFMLVFAILTVGLGALQLRNTIYGPFIVRRAAVDPISTLTNNDEARLKNIDTDHDGLNDYEELSQYETSPYLPDSDSDGTGDKAEIEKGTDPLCPEGRVCTENAAATGVTPTTTVSSPLLNDSLTIEGVLKTTQELSVKNTDVSADLDLQAIVENPEQLRALMLSTGKIDQATLDKITDAELQDMAKKLLNKPETALAPSNPASTTAR